MIAKEPKVPMFILCSCYPAPDNQTIADKASDRDRSNNDCEAMHCFSDSCVVSADKRYQTSLCS